MTFTSESALSVKARWRKRYFYMCFRVVSSSFTEVVLHKMSPSETLFLESANKIVKAEVADSSLVQFSIWDLPGQFPKV